MRAQLTSHIHKPSALLHLTLFHASIPRLQYHPDLNKAENAEVKFISIGEAYNFLVRLAAMKTNKGTLALTRAHLSRLHTHSFKHICADYSSSSNTAYQSLN